MLVDGDLVLTESAAIVTYLGDHYAPASQQPPLVPEPRTLTRARYDEWLSFIQMELDAHTLYIMRKHRDLADLYGEAPAAVETAIDGFNKQVRVAVDRLAASDYLLGDHFSAADLLLMTCLEWASAYGFDLDPRLTSYRKKISQRPAYLSARTLNFSISPGA